MYFLMVWPVWNSVPWAILKYYYKIPILIYALYMDTLLTELGEGLLRNIYIYMYLCIDFTQNECLAYILKYYYLIVFIGTQRIVTIFLLVVIKHLLVRHRHIRAKSDVFFRNLTSYLD